MLKFKYLNNSRHQRTLRNGVKQAKAGQFLKETVFDKIVDKEDELIAEEEKKETNLYWRAVKKHDEDKIEMKKSLNDFKQGISIAQSNF